MVIPLFKYDLNIKHYNFIIIPLLFKKTAIQHITKIYPVSITIAYNGGVRIVLTVKFTSPVSRFPSKNTNNWFVFIELIINDEDGAECVYLAANIKNTVCAAIKKRL